jgi:O-antigen/teichoic acid export membrane protein
MTEHTKVTRAALGIIGTRSAIYPIKIIVALVVAPLLGTTDYGIYAFLILPGAVLMPLLTFGTTSGVRYYISTGEYRPNDVVLAAFGFGWLNGLVTAAVFGGLWSVGWLGKTGVAISSALVVPVLLVLPLQGLAWSMSRVMIGASWFTAMNLYMFLNNLLPPVFLTAFVIIAGRGIEGAVESIVATSVVLSVITTAMVIVRYRPSWKLDARFLAKASKYGLKAWMGSLANSVSTRLDQFVLGFVQAPEALGVYRIAVMIAELLWLIPDSVSVPLFNRISQTEKREERVSMVARGHRVLMPAGAIAGLSLLAVAWWAVPAFLGTEYIDARWLLGLLIPGTVALVTSRLLGMFFMASGQPEKASLIHIIGAVASFIAYITLIPILGVAGAALGTSAAYIVTATAAYWMFSSAVAPAKVKLFFADTDDFRWAFALIRDALGIWSARFRRAH